MTVSLPTHNSNYDGYSTDVLYTDRQVSGSSCVKHGVFIILTVITATGSLSNIIGLQ